MAHDVFVSYTSEDKPTADALCATLERNGIRCWIAPRDILPGLEWSAAIVDAINASRVMVLVYSARANESPQIKREVERGVNRGLSVIPFRIEDVPMSKSLEYFMSMPHWLDALTPPLQDHLDRLADTTRLILERAGVPPTTAPGDRRHRSPSVPPLTSSRDIARGFGRWVTGGTESSTLAEAFVPRSDRIATASLIAAGVLVISVLAQVRVGPIWLQPLALLLTAAVLGSRGGALAASIYITLGILGLPVFGRGFSAWTAVEHRAPYIRYALGYLAGSIAASYAVGWLAERRSWDRHPASAARLALVGIGLMYVPGVIWLELASLLMRESRGPSGVLPSIPMLAISVGVVAFALPRLWARVAVFQREVAASGTQSASDAAAPAETTHSIPRQ
jgi:biotin transporter BioY